MLAPFMKKYQKLERLKYANSFLLRTFIWTKVIFLDKKKFNLNGPDGSQYYWHNLWKDPELFSKQQNKGEAEWFGVHFLQMELPN